MAAVRSLLNSNIQGDTEVVGRLTKEGVGRAAIDVEPSTKTARCAWPTRSSSRNPLLGSILVLPRKSVSMLELEVPLHILLVAFQAMKRSRHDWDTVTEDVQKVCMQHLTARLRSATCSWQGSTSSIASSTSDPGREDPKRKRRCFVKTGRLNAHEDEAHSHRDGRRGRRRDCAMYSQYG